MIVAIDGPSGAGKSSVAKIVARELGFSCLDTGAMYRMVALKAVREGVDLNDNEALGRLARGCDISFGYDEGDPAPKKFFLDGEDVSNDIRTMEIDKAVTPVSAAPAVREASTELQRKIGNTGNYVIDGRDIGTVVFPNAEVKVFLTASAEERAHRRVRQNVDRGVGSVNYDEVLADLKRRDEADMNRATAPLKQADDAVLIDSTNHHIEDVISQICDLARQKM